MGKILNMKDFIKTQLAMKYKYHCTCEPPNGVMHWYGSRCIYSDPYEALSAGVKRIMRMHVNYPGNLDEYCNKIEVYDKNCKLVMRLGTSYFVNNL